MDILKLDFQMYQYVHNYVLRSIILRRIIYEGSFLRVFTLRIKCKIIYFTSLNKKAIQFNLIKCTTKPQYHRLTNPFTFRRICYIKTHRRF